VGAEDGVGTESSSYLSHQFDAGDELLELIWTEREQGRSSLAEMVRRSDQLRVSTLMTELEARGLVRLDGDTITFTETGDLQAQMIIRRHRLAERLMVDVFGVSLEGAEHFACQFEHYVNPEVVGKICTLLGHPEVCPHSRPIPPGKCCVGKSQSIEPVVVRLLDLAVGKDGRITYINPRDHDRLDRLSSFGIVPGRVVRVHQRQPSFVLKLGETDLAIEEDIARDIFVKPIEQ